MGGANIPKAGSATASNIPDTNRKARRASYDCDPAWAIRKTPQRKMLIEMYFASGNLLANQLQSTVCERRFTYESKRFPGMAQHSHPT